MTEIITQGPIRYGEEVKIPAYDEGKLPEDHEHDKNLFIKVYETLLTNMAVQNGMKKINKISQPILDIYHDHLEDKISDIRQIGQGVINTTKEKLTSWLYHVNIYSHLVGLWIFQNTPFTKCVIPEEEYLRAFETFVNAKKKGNVEQDMEIARDFYQIMAEVWVKLLEPTPEEIKDTLLVVTAKTIAKRLGGGKNEFFAENLVNTFKDIVESNKEIVSDEAFIEIVKKLTGNAWTNDVEFKRGTQEFYDFAKRFTLIDLPLVDTTKSVSRALLNYVQDTSVHYANAALDFIDQYLTFFMLLVGIDMENNFETNSLIVKSKHVLGKTAILAQACLEKSAHYATNNRLYLTVDGFVHFGQRKEDFICISLSIYDVYKERIYLPTRKLITCTYDKMTETYTVVLEGLMTDFVKEQLLKIKETYELLKEATFYLKEKVLEIKIDKKSLEGYREETIEQIEKLYDELKAGEVCQLKEKATNLYLEAIATLKARKQKRALPYVEKKTF